jgi:hypothetical protein
MALVMVSSGDSLGEGFGSFRKVPSVIGDGEGLGQSGMDSGTWGVPGKDLEKPWGGFGKDLGKGLGRVWKDLGRVWRVWVYPGVARRRWLVWSRAAEPESHKKLHYK